MEGYGVIFFIFLLFGVHGVSWICGHVTVFTILGVFSDIVS